MKYVPKPGDSKKINTAPSFKEYRQLKTNNSQNIILKVVYGVTMT